MGLVTLAMATALWLADCLHPTHRKVRDGWGTLSFVASRKGQTKASAREWLEGCRGGEADFSASLLTIGL
jgi:hypothetical protein